MGLSLIIPCYNYENSVVANYDKLKKKINNIKENVEIIFIDDGSTDNTYKKLKNLQKKNKTVKVLKNSINQGKSFSLILGIKKSKYDKIVIYDCDLPYFNYFNKVIAALEKHSLVYINRKSKKSNLKTKKLNFYQLMRFLIGRIMCLFINFSCLNLGIGDTQAGLKAFKKPKKFKKIKFKSKKFFFDAEIMIIFYLLKKKMKYIPVEYSIPKDSTIKIFEFKNFLYLYELLKVIIYYKLVSKKKYTTLV